MLRQLVAEREKKHLSLEFVVKRMHKDGPVPFDIDKVLARSIEDVEVKNFPLYPMHNHHPPSLSPISIDVGGRRRRGGSSIR
jgi:hypothetical protein